MGKQAYIILTVLAAVLFITFCLYNLNNQYAFTGDPARDTLQSYRLLQSKDITLIGPPLSLGQNGLRETYFSSLIYYLSAFMLLISRNSLFAPVVLIAFINATAIVPLVLIGLRERLQLKQIALLAGLYITNPLVVIYSRILWNPSPLIGIGVWGMWALVTSSIVFGIVCALAFYFHYFAGILLLSGIAYYYIKRQYKNILSAVASFIASLFPFILFEIKNQFYLSRSLLYNLLNTYTGSSIAEKAKFFLQIPVTLLGMVPDSFGTFLINIAPVGTLVGILVWLYLAYRNKHSFYFYFFVAASLLTCLASKMHYISIQYLFIAFGAFLMVIIKSGFLRKSPIIYIILCLQFINTAYAVSRNAQVFTKEPFLKVSQLEAAAKTIEKDHNKSLAMNITENFTGDARAMYLRFFLERDKVPNLKNELQYTNLDELYVLTSSLQRTLKENRWEFNASHLTLQKQVPIDSFLILVYKKKS